MGKRDRFDGIPSPGPYPSTPYGNSNSPREVRGGASKPASTLYVLTVVGLPLVIIAFAAIWLAR